MSVSICRCAIGALLGLILYVPNSEGDLIAYWDFNDSNLVVDQGTGTLTTSFAAADVGYSAGSTKNARPGVAAGQALRLEDQANNSSGRLDLAFSTAGYKGLTLSLATQKTATGFNSNQLSYSTNGGATFSTFGAPFNPPTAFDAITFDLSGIESLDNIADARLRITFSGATSSTGNNRIDNIQLNAEAGVTATPEPGTGLLAGMAGAVLGLQRWRRRRKLTVVS